MAVSYEATPRRWRALAYDTEQFSGVMLLAGPETAAPEVRYPLGASGWHAVSIGLYGDMRGRVQALAKLSNEDTFSVLTLPQVDRERREHIHELFWRAADLTGQELVLGQMSWRTAPGDGPGSLSCSDARIAYIKLVPLTPEEVDAIRSDRRRDDTRRLFAHNDAHIFHFKNRPTTAEEIRRNIECFRHTDFSRIYWEAGSGDTLRYFSKIGRAQTLDGLGDFERQGDRLHAESWRVFRDQGVDPFEVALQHAHDIGLEFHASYRVAGFHSPPPLDYDDLGATFYKYHPELRGTDRNGNRTPRMSYAYPEVRRFVISLLREMAGFPIDGVCLLYNRRPPLVEYEPPVVEGFQEEFGEDPFQLDEMDRRWLSYRARTLTQFHREVREAMDDEAEKQGRKRIEVSAIVMRDEEENLANAMDLKAWVDEGLVDTIIPFSSEPNLAIRNEVWTDPRYAEYFVSLTKGTSCKLALNIIPRQMSPEAYRNRAAALYRAGVENLFFWDSNVDRADFSRSWNALRRLGHRDELEAWSDAGGPGLETETLELRKLGDWDLSYATPG